MDRRTFSKQILAAATSFALMDSLFAFNAIQSKIRPITGHWALELNTMCQDLNKSGITPIEWQNQIEKLFQQLPREDLIRFIDFENLSKGFNFPDLGVSTKQVVFPSMEGLPEKTVFIKKIFGMKKGRAIIPHGHSNMASAHFVLQGDMHLRHYEKIGQSEDYLIVKPTIDKIVTPGDYSSISDRKDNIHWFVAETDSAFTFDVIMLDLNQKAYDIHNLDMAESEDLHDGTFRVKEMDVETALKKYGKETHH